MGAGGCGQVTKHRQPGARVAGGGERTGLFDAQIGQAVRGRRVGGGGERPRGAPVAGGVAQIAQQLQQLTPVRGGRVRQGLLRPPLTVAICADGGRSLCRRCQQRHRLAATARREQVVGDPLGRAAALAKARRCPQMRVDELFGIELPAGGVAQQRVAKAQSGGVTLQDTPAQRSADRRLSARLLDAGDHREIRDGEAILQSGGEQHDGPRVPGQAAEPDVEDLADVLGDAHVAVVGRGGDLLGEERIARRGGGDRLERPRSQRPAGGALGDTW